MTKPTENLDWATNGTVNDILEPTGGQRTSGITLGGSWTRKRLNWMFNGLGKWIDWVKDNVRSDAENDSRFIASNPPLIADANSLVVSGIYIVGSDWVGSPDAGLSGDNQGTLTHTQWFNDYATQVFKDINTNNDTLVRQNNNNVWSSWETTAKLGITGTTVRNNTQNDARFVQHTEVVDSLTSTSTTNPLSANQGKELKDQADTALVEGTAGTQGRNNTQNDARFLLEANNLSDLNSAATARTNLDVLQKGVGINDARTNDQNDARFVFGIDPASKTQRERLGIFEGSVSSGGVTTDIPFGWSVSKTGTGEYTITQPSAGVGMLTATVAGTLPYFISVLGQTIVKTFDSSGTASDIGFNFIYIRTA